MIKAIELYLITENNGLEAVDFYKDVFNAEVISCTTYGDAIPNTPENIKDMVLNAQLNINGIRLQISDAGLERGYTKGNNINVCIQSSEENYTRELYSKLAKDAKKIELEIQETPWSPAYGIVVDKYGVTWQLNTDIAGFISGNVKF